MTGPTAADARAGLAREPALSDGSLLYNRTRSSAKPEQILWTPSKNVRAAAEATEAVCYSCNGEIVGLVQRESCQNLIHRTYFVDRIQG